MTPRELVLHFDGALRRQEREREGRAWLAWNAGIIGRLKRPPRSFEDLLPRKPPKRQPPDAMLAAALAWHMAVTRRDDGIAGRNPTG